jgi:hypothetical protein
MMILSRKVVPSFSIIISPQNNQTDQRRPLGMKYSRAATHCKTYKVPELQFESQRLTSFSGLVIYQKLFSHIRIKERISKCFRNSKSRPIFGHTVVVMYLIVHLLLGYRHLREGKYYKDDPMVKRILGLRRLPDVATVSRVLSSTDKRSAEKLRRLCRRIVIERVHDVGLRRITLDFDGSVQSTKRNAEGSAVGFNKKKKGNRSYYPLFCTIAQTGQVLDFLHRAGNVHDSNGAKGFIRNCIRLIRSAYSGAVIEARMDSAFFNQEVIEMLEAMGVEFTVSVPFERFAELKGQIESRKRWKRYDDELSYFETRWKPKKWAEKYRFLFIRNKVKRQRKGPMQLDLFIPHVNGYEFKVIVSNKTAGMKKVLAFHNGRGSQEGMFGELKAHCQMDYIATKRLVGNQIYLQSAIFAHNLSRELQMITLPRTRNTTEKRSSLWQFHNLNTLRRNIIQRVGRLTMPQGKLTLTMSANSQVRKEVLHYLERLDSAA